MVNSSFFKLLFFFLFHQFPVLTFWDGELNVPYLYKHFTVLFFFVFFSFLSLSMIFHHLRGSGSLLFFCLLFFSLPFHDIPSLRGSKSLLFFAFFSFLHLLFFSLLFHHIPSPTGFTSEAPSRRLNFLRRWTRPSLNTTLSVVIVPISLSLLFSSFTAIHWPFFFFLYSSFFIIIVPVLFLVFYHVRFSYSFSLPSFPSLFVAALSISSYLFFISVLFFFFGLKDHGKKAWTFLPIPTLSLITITVLSFISPGLFPPSSPCYLILALLPHPRLATLSLQLFLPSSPCYLVFPLT